jgi:hypothetical protein
MAHSRGAVMNSNDPWRVMLSSPPGERMIVPAPFYGNVFLGDNTYGRPFIGADLKGEKQMSAAPNIVSQSSSVVDRGALTAQVAPVVAPATGGFSALALLDDDQRLHVAVCVDGKPYRASMDLAPVIAAMMTKFAQYHAGLHGPGALQAPVVSGAVLGAVDQAVCGYADELIGALVDRHVTVACGSFLDDIGNALKGAGGAIFGAVQDTVKALKGPITAAATAGIAMIPGVGPVVAPMAAQLVGPLIDTAANAGRPHPAVAAAQQAAKTDPQAAQALDVAKTAAANAITAHHISRTAQLAAVGHPVAQQQIAQITQDAQRGDPAAVAVAPAVSHGYTVHAQRQHGQQAGPETYRESASRAVARDYAKYQQQGGPPPPAIGYLRYTEGGKHHHKIFVFHAPGESQSWWATLVPSQYVYAAVFDPRNLSAPLSENFGAAMAA